MDRLARNAMLARQAEMSYGKWKALQPVVPIEKPEIPEGWLVCEWCRKPFKPKTKRKQKFCEISCQQESHYSRKNSTQRVRAWRAKKRAEAGGSDV